MSWIEAYGRAFAAVLYLFLWQAIGFGMISGGATIIWTLGSDDSSYYLVGGGLALFGLFLVLLSGIAVGLKILTDAIGSHVPVRGDSPPYSDFRPNETSFKFNANVFSFRGRLSRKGFVGMWLLAWLLTYVVVGIQVNFWEASRSWLPASQVVFYYLVASAIAARLRGLESTPLWSVLVVIPFTVAISPWLFPTLFFFFGSFGWSVLIFSMNIALGLLGVLAPTKRSRPASGFLPS